MKRVPDQSALAAAGKAGTVAEAADAGKERGN